ncbi:peptidylprolyl isomerase [Allomuricauda sp. SCSIO 65647]|uniref:peptidylprolyl isomerase n=1 Tax=Allomuricauda sp. SCSIO 65647 TaxID=2908843 RepID=UPI001F3C4669|nr:peptidylprolyl isomerase [Muricauda sp. SCSIO 65647]UJH67903.1 peptidylprolyl isomerase [Muricauda sp. SCSIO 65647]
MKNRFLYLLTLTVFFTACKSSKYADLGDGIFADIQTSKGEIVVKLYHEATPVTVANFVSLAEGNSPFVDDRYKEKKYYDGLVFHRVIKDFMIQGGDPEGTGRGNPGYKFKDEFVDTLKHAKKGLLSMANSGPKTNGSQFFITHKATPWLDGKHTVFGEVIKGIEVVDSIANTKTVVQDKPEVDVVMKKVEIIRNGRNAKKFDAIQVMADYFAEEEEAIAAMKKRKEDLVFDFQSQIENAETTDSGLKILKLKEGSGEQPKIGQKVLVNYAGWLMADGELFDSNLLEVAEKFEKVNLRLRDQGGYRPTPMLYSPEAQLFPGFREGMLTMKVGDKVRLFLPPHLGTGDRDYGPIPGGSTLVFDLEITDIAQ